MKTSAAKKTAVLDPIGQPRTRAENEALLERIKFWTEDSKTRKSIPAHRKTEEEIASRVARKLNAEKIPCTAHRHWTGAHVLMVSIAIKK